MSEAVMPQIENAKPRAEITVSTKGVVTWSVKAYGNEPYMAEACKQAVTNAQAMHAMMLETYGKQVPD